MKHREAQTLKNWPAHQATQEGVKANRKVAKANEKVAKDNQKVSKDDPASTAGTEWLVLPCRAVLDTWGTMVGMPGRPGMRT